MRWVLLFLLFFLPIIVAGQNSISGRIHDLEQDQPLENVSIHINGSSWGTLSKSDGSFELKGGFSFPLVLVVQLLSYETQSFTLHESGAMKSILKLKPKVEVLEEFNVLPPIRDGWAIYGKAFAEGLIGYSAFAEQCEILNKDQLVFKFDKDAGKLYVTANEPLRIKNSALGYLINYELVDFEQDFAKQTVHFNGYSKFEPLKTENKRRQSNWVKNRLSSYRGSFFHFVRAIYASEVAKDQFQLNVVDRAPAGEYGTRVPIWTDSIDFKDPANLQYLKRLIWASACDFTSDTVAVDSLLLRMTDWVQQDQGEQTIKASIPLIGEVEENGHFVTLHKLNRSMLEISYFDPSSRSTKRNMGKLMTSTTAEEDAAFNALVAKQKQRQDAKPFDYLYTMPNPIDSFINTQPDGTIQLFSQKMIQVIYHPELEEQAYIDRHCLIKKTETPSPQTSLLNFIGKKPINLVKDGNFYTQYDLLFEGYWSFEKLDKMLPLDYQP